MNTLLRESAASLAFLAVISGLAGLAQAADVMEPPSPAYSWTGLYVGAYAGPGALVTKSDAEAANVSDFEFDEGDDGFLYGALIGLNWQVGERFVLGLQGDIAFTDIEVANSFLDTNIGPDFIASASLRAGILLTPDTLLYAIGGYSYSEFDNGEVADPELQVDVDAFDGFHIGAGMETRLTERLTARLEYRYTDLGSQQIFADNDIELTYDFAPHIHSATLGLAYNLFPTEGEGAVASPAADVAPPAVSWTGLYLGINAGAGALLSDLEEFDDGYEGGGEGFLGSLMAGYNWQAGERFVLGLEGAIGLSDMQWDADFLSGPINEELSLDLDWFASASLRAGWLATPETMIYVIGGYNYAEAEFEFNFIISDFPLVAGNATEGLHGFHIGAGIEATLTDGLTARIEYRYTDYGEATFDIEGIETDAEFGIDARTHTGTIGLAWLFN